MLSKADCTELVCVPWSKGVKSCQSWWSVAPANLWCLACFSSPKMIRTGSLALPRKQNTEAPHFLSSLENWVRHRNSIGLDAGLKFCLGWASIVELNWFVCEMLGWHRDLKSKPLAEAGKAAKRRRHQGKDFSKNMKTKKGWEKDGGRDEGGRKEWRKRERILSHTQRDVNISLCLAHKYDNLTLN